MKNYTLKPRELSILRRRHKEEKRKNHADKLKSVYLLGSGWTVGAVSEALLIDEITIYRYYDTYWTGGIRALLALKYKGKDIELTEAEYNELDMYLQACPCRTTKEVIAYVQEEFEVDYSISGMNKLLRRLGYTYKKPRKVPGKANVQAQKEFIKRYRKIRDAMTPEDSLFFMDGVHPQHNPIVEYGWFKKGSKQVLRTNTQYHRLHINGVVDIDRFDVITQTSQRLDAEATLDMLEKLRKKRPKGKLYLVLDNAGYYQLPRVKAYAEAIGIELLFLPPYSPNLNLIERLWGLMQRNILYNRYYPTFAEMKQACVSFFKSLRWRKEELRILLTERFEQLPA